MKRQLRFETLDSRLCMAFGDIDTNFAQNGEYSVSYNFDVNASETIAKIIELPDGLLFFANSSTGAGTIVTIAKTDFNGVPDSSFAIGGMKRIVDPKSPFRGISDVIQLSNGSFVLQLRDADTLMTLVGVKPDGTVDTTFGDSGYLRSGFKKFGFLATIVADTKDGFYLIQSYDQTGDITKYTPSGSIDSTFATAGTFTFPRIINYDVAVDAQGMISIVGLRPVGNNLQLTSIHLNADGTPDESFGVSGMRTNTTPVTFSYPVIDETDGSIFFWQDTQNTSATAKTFLLVKFSADVTPDVSFGVDGRTTFEIPGAMSSSLSGKPVPDRTGGVFLSRVMPITPGLPAWSVLTAKVTAAGILDPNYGASGIARNDVPAGGTLLTNWLDSSGNFFWYGHIQPNRNVNYVVDAYIAKVLPDGSIDKRFGTSGYLQRDFTIQSQTIDQLRLLPNLAGVMTVASGWPAYGTPNPNTGKATTFSSAGSLVGNFDFGGLNTQLNVVSAPSFDGGWFAATFASQSGSNGVGIRKFLPNGTLDGTFGTSGELFVATERMDDLRIHSARDGSITVAAADWLTKSDPATTLGVAVAVRIRPNGELDKSFGSGGILRLYQKAGNLVDVMHDDALGTALVFYNVSTSPEITIRVFNSAGAALNSFGNQGESKVTAYGSRWNSGAIDEFGRLLFAVSPPTYFLPNQARLYQLEPSGKLSTSFGSSGSIALPLDFNYAFSNVDLAVRHGVIAVAGTNSFDAAAVRLIAFDYAGKPMTELGPGGFRDYDLSTNGESVEDLQFADDGSLWLAISDRSEFNKIGKVLRLGGSTAAPLHNWLSALDVSGDKKISPLDALLVINRLQSPTASPGSMPDTNGDAVISPIDALLVINWLNKNSLGSGEGEQEADEASVDSQVAAVDFLFAEFEGFSDIRRSNRTRR